MRLLLIIAVLILCSSVSVASQIESMQLKGEGDVSFLGFIKVYDAYLYLDSDTVKNDVLNPEISKCLKLQYDVSLSKENFIEGATTVLVKQHSTELLESLQPEVEKLHNAYQPVEEGDVYTLCYDANSSTTTLSLNNSELTSITSEPFSSLYFGIWLSEKDPIDEDLRNDLLHSVD